MNCEAIEIRMEQIDNCSPHSTALPLPNETIQNPARPTFPEEWKVSSLQEIVNGQLIEPRWIIEDLLLEQSGTLVSGLPHAGKSLNLLSAAIESVTTHKVWNRFDSSSVKRVLYIETEDPEVVVRKRIRGLVKGLQLDPKTLPEGFHLAVTGPFDITAMETQLNALIDFYKPDWVVISTLQGLLVDRDWKEQKDMSRVNAIFVRLARKCPIVVVTHSTWNKENKRAAGSVTQAANFLTLIHFEKKIAADGETTTTVSLDSKMGGEFPEFDLKLETEVVAGKPDVRRVVYAPHEPSKKEQILAYRKENPKASVKEIAAQVGASEKHVRNTLNLKTPKPTNAVEDFNREVFGTDEHKGTTKATAPRNKSRSTRAPVAAAQ
jgi:hypothetical protein